MMVLNSLDFINIKGSYGSDSGSEATSSARLTRVKLESAVEMTEAVADPALSVEQCQCPEGYTGMSCELCSPGYFSSRKDIWGPICMPCNCHGHADSCHPLTGECFSWEPMPFIRLDPGIPTNHPNGSYGTLDDYCHYNPAECTVSTDDTVSKGLNTQYLTITIPCCSIASTTPVASIVKSVTRVTMEMLHCLMKMLVRLVLVLGLITSKLFIHLIILQTAIDVIEEIK